MFLGSESKLSVPWLDVFLEAKLLIMGALMAELLATGEADCPSLRKPPLSGNSRDWTWPMKLLPF